MPSIVVCSGSGCSRMGSGPKGADDLEFKHEAGISALRLGFHSRVWDLSFNTGI